ncbi:3-hydroxy-3-methylglutaryl-coenzyme a reductase [Fusarium langsethiae]|uniref:3-hydroxy-3-methylglutaryl coenzyme A reductase n=1 Tax=Fusarium langsethiae TaxID=179993 RepID=A0A0N0V4P9_FUSLA|nr:3-hydroxy-3-methylglutaryl-coenzyme a reductase [Fusarium langsethiae]GKU10699.1 unnamed protein product [Fusarium langsethiae]
MNSSGFLSHTRQVASRRPNASWLNRKVTSFLQLLSRLTFVNPITAVALVALLASLSYIVILEDTLSSGASQVAIDNTAASWQFLVRGSQQLRATPMSNWTWHSDDSEVSSQIDHLALLTLIFPGTTLSNTVSFQDIQGKNVSFIPLPFTSRLRSIDAEHTALAFCVPYVEATKLLPTLQEIPNTHNINKDENKIGPERKTWIMRGERERRQGMGLGKARISVAQWVRGSYSAFLDLLKTTQTLDIVLMALVYVSMNITIATLIVSMRRLGSRISLAAGVLISSFFAFLFGLLVTTKIFHTPITIRLLSEGLPFLVVVIGFEKNITLSQSALSHAIEHKQPSGRPDVARYAIDTAIQDTGFRIVRDYAVEILLLVAGSLSGIQGGLQELCFLAAWILFFDCVLLFLFYAPILCIKLEIDRIMRRIDVRSALQDDGISHRVAENIARVSSSGSLTIFGNQVNRFRDIPSLKIIMAGCVGLVILANVAYVAYVEGASFLLTSFPIWSRHLGNTVITNPSIDPFKVAPEGLEFLLESAKMRGQGIAVDILRPINYELTDAFTPATNSEFGTGTNGFALPNVGTSVTDSLLKGLEDPVLLRWIMGVLPLSIAFNVYLFNAARWGINNDTDRKNGEPVSVETSTFIDHKTTSRTIVSGCNPADMAERSKPGEQSAETVHLPVTELLEGSKSPRRTSQQVIELHQAKRTHELDDEEVVALSLQGMIPGYALEKTLNFDYNRAVKVRRTIISRAKVTANLTYLLGDSNLPYRDYNWSQVFGACCENVIGYMPIPVGVAGPLVIDGRSYFIPMATTEGVLVASVSRGAKAINAHGGAVTVLTSDGMTRGPCLGFKSLERAGQAKLWLDSQEGQKTMEDAFNSTSRFARLEGMDSVLAGTNLYIRFKASTADAMGMNMISKGVERALSVMKDTAFEDTDIVTLTGNYCSDKKASAINWVQGRGKSVVAEALIPADVVKAVLKTDIDSLVDVFLNKNMIGSAMAGSIGGFNAQAANIVAAVFIATGQDPAQVVESSNCITIMKRVDEFLHITVSMPSIEVGTLGGGTILDPQGAMLDLLGVRGPHDTQPGANACRLARIIAAATMAGELSLCSALAAGHLVTAHMQHNRSATPTRSNTPAPAPGQARFSGSNT